MGLTFSYSCTLPCIFIKSAASAGKPVIGNQALPILPYWGVCVCEGRSTGRNTFARAIPHLAVFLLLLPRRKNQKVDKPQASLLSLGKRGEDAEPMDGYNGLGQESNIFFHYLYKDIGRDRMNIAIPFQVYQNRRSFFLGLSASSWAQLHDLKFPWVFLVNFWQAHYTSGTLVCRPFPADICKEGITLVSFWSLPPPQKKINPVQWCPAR